MTIRRLTPKQRRVLEFIQRYGELHGCPPTQQEIAAGLGFRSLGTVQNYLVRLQEQGFLRRPWNAKRALEVVSPERETRGLPLLGWVAAGKPIEAVASEDELDVPPSLLGRGEHFVLRVDGHSMVEDGILDRDYLVVRRQSTARDGQTVVALVDGAATVKRFYRRRGEVELKPANGAMEPIRVRGNQDLRLEGIVVAVIRRCG
ncbi:MAG: transcriptional repressor LexA [Deferrisomatales bacterium]